MKKRMILIGMGMLLTILVVISQEDITFNNLDWNNPTQVEAFWTDPTRIATVSDVDFINAMDTQDIVGYDAVWDSLDERSAGDISVLNDNDWLLDAWLDRRGIGYTSGAQLENYDQYTGIITTKGPGSTTFDSALVPSAKILQDGSLQLKQGQTISNGGGIIQDSKDPNNIIV